MENKYKAIDDIDDIYRLNSYMEDEYTTKSITTEYLRKVDEKFNSLVAKRMISWRQPFLSVYVVSV